MDGFEQIYQEYFQDVYLFVLAISRDPSIAEDITQETFFKALKGIDKFRGSCSIKVWLCQIAKNTYYSHLKKNPAESAGIEGETADETDLAEALIRKERTVSLYKLIRLLEEPYKEVFILRVLGDLSFREIGEIFDRKEGWARVTFHRAKTKLQLLVKEE